MLKEITRLRTREAKHFLNADGTYMAEISNGPRHYKSHTEGWWRDKVQAFSFDEASSLVSSTDSDVAVVAYERGVERRARIEVTEHTSGVGLALEMFAKPRPGLLPNELALTDKNGGNWSLFHKRTGTKLLGPKVHKASGRQQYAFGYELLGAPPLRVLLDGSVVSDGVLRLKRPCLIGADGKTYPASPWRLGEGEISFTFTDRALPPQAYPYRIDPDTTFPVAVDVDDQNVYREDVAYPPAGAFTLEKFATNVVPTRMLSGGIYYVRNCFVRHNTSSLGSGATVSSATSRMYCFDRTVTTPQAYSVVMEWNHWTPDITTGDWTNTITANAYAGIDYSSIPVNADFDFALLNPDANIQKTSYTGLKINLTDPTAPTVPNFIQFASYDHATLAEPRLLVSYGFTTRLAPDAIISRTNLPNVNGVTANDATALAAIDEDPDSADTDWLTV